MVAHFLQSVTARLVLGGELVYHRRPGEEGAILTLAGKYSGRDTSGTLWGHLGDVPAVSPRRWLCVAAPNWVTTLNVGYGGAHASYYHRANEQVGVPWCPQGVPRCHHTPCDSAVPSRCRWGWSWRPTPGCRRPPSPSATSSTCHEPTWSSEVGRAPGGFCAQMSPAGGTQLSLLSPPGLLDSNWSVGGVLEKKLPPLPVTLALGAFLNHWRNRFHCGFSVTVG